MRFLLLLLAAALCLGFTPHGDWTIRQTVGDPQIIESCLGCSQGLVRSEFDQGPLPNVFAVGQGIMYHTGLSDGTGMQFDEPTISWTVPTVTEQERGRSFGGTSTGTATGWKDITGTFRHEYTGSVVLTGSMTKDGDGTASIVLDLPTQRTSTQWWMVSPVFGDSPAQKRQQKNNIDTDGGLVDTAAPHTYGWRAVAKLGGFQRAMYVYVGDSATDWCNGGNIGTGTLPADTISILDEPGLHRLRYKMATNCTFVDGDTFDYAIRIQGSPSKPYLTDWRQERLTSLSSLHTLTRDDIGTRWSKLIQDGNNSAIYRRFGTYNYKQSEVEDWARRFTPLRPIPYAALGRANQGDFTNSTDYRCADFDISYTNVTKVQKALQFKWFGANDYSDYYGCDPLYFSTKLAEVKKVATWNEQPHAVYFDHADFGRHDWNAAEAIFPGSIAAGRGVANVEAWWKFWEDFDRTYDGQIHCHNDTLPAPNSPFCDWTWIGEVFSSDTLGGTGPDNHTAAADYLNDGALGYDFWMSALMPRGTGVGILPQCKGRDNETACVQQVIGLGYVLDVPVWLGVLTDTTPIVADELAKIEAFGSLADDNVNVYPMEECEDGTSPLRCAPGDIVNGDADMITSVYDCTGTCDHDGMVVAMNSGTSIASAATVQLDIATLGLGSVNEYCLSTDDCSKPSGTGWTAMAGGDTVDFGAMDASPSGMEVAYLRFEPVTAEAAIGTSFTTPVAISSLDGAVAYNVTLSNVGDTGTSYDATFAAVSDTSCATVAVTDSAASGVDATPTDDTVTYTVNASSCTAGETETATFSVTCTAGTCTNSPLTLDVTIQVSVPTACGDGVDNDGDGLTDFPTDRGCASANDNDEQSELECDNGLDDDGDGQTDFPNDPECISEVDDSEGGSLESNFIGTITSSLTTTIPSKGPRCSVAFDTSGLVHDSITETDEDQRQFDHSQFYMEVSLDTGVSTDTWVGAPNLQQNEYRGALGPVVFVVEAPPGGGDVSGTATFNIYGDAGEEVYTQAVAYGPCKDPLTGYGTTYAVSPTGDFTSASAGLDQQIDMGDTDLHEALTVDVNMDVDGSGDKYIQLMPAGLNGYVLDTDVSTIHSDIAIHCVGDWSASTISITTQGGVNILGPWRNQDQRNEFSQVVGCRFDHNGTFITSPNPRNIGSPFGGGSGSVFSDNELIDIASMSPAAGSYISPDYENWRLGATAHRNTMVDPACIKAQGSVGIYNNRQARTWALGNDQSRLCDGTTTRATWEHGHRQGCGPGGYHVGNRVRSWGNTKSGITIRACKPFGSTPLGDGEGPPWIHTRVGYNTIDAARGSTAEDPDSSTSPGTSTPLLVEAQNSFTEEYSWGNIFEWNYVEMESQDTHSQDLFGLKQSHTRVQRNTFYTSKSSGATPIKIERKKGGGGSSSIPVIEDIVFDSNTIIMTNTASIRCVDLPECTNCTSHRVRNNVCYGPSVASFFSTGSVDGSITTGGNLVETDLSTLDGNGVISTGDTDATDYQVYLLDGAIGGRVATDEPCWEQSGAACGSNSGADTTN